MSEISRRRFVGGALAASATALAAGCGGGSAAPARPADRAARPAGGHAPPSEPVAYEDWASVRALFDLRPDVHHLSAYIIAPHSRPVREEIERHRRGLDRDAQGYRREHAWREERAAEMAAAHLGSTIDSIALTDSTTMGLGTFLGGLKLTEDDEILVTVHEHFAARDALSLSSSRTGAKLREIELYPPKAPERATVQGIVNAVEDGIDDRTRAVVVTWVHSASGVRLPIREIADVVERANRGRAPEERALLVVDGAHALGTGELAPEDAGCDVLIAGCHKWLLGPRGTGLVWARAEAWERTAPTIPSWSQWGHSVGHTSGGAIMTPGGYHSFEHRWALSSAFALQRRVGQDRIAARIDALADRLRAGIADIDGLTLHAPGEHRLLSGVVCFTVAGRSPQDVVQELGDEHRVAATVTPYDVEFARLGTHWITTEAEVDAAIEAVAAVAR